MVLSQDCGMVSRATSCYIVWKCVMKCNYLILRRLMHAWLSLDYYFLFIFNKIELIESCWIKQNWKASFLTWLWGQVMISFLAAGISEPSTIYYFAYLPEFSDNDRSSLNNQRSNVKNPVWLFWGLFFPHICSLSLFSYLTVRKNFLALQKYIACRTGNALKSWAYAVQIHVIIFKHSISKDEFKRYRKQTP